MHILQAPMTSKPYMMLTTYHLPTPLRCWKVGEELTKFTKWFGLKPLHDPLHPAQDWAPWSHKTLHAEVKRRTPKNPGGSAWHYDGDTTPGSKVDCAIVLWSEHTPTEFRRNGSDKVYTPQPFEVVIFHNRHCTHRRPPGLEGKRRFIFRQRVEIPTEFPLP